MQVDLVGPDAARALVAQVWRVYDALMSDLHHDRALLSTDAAPTPAVGLYLCRGWERIGLLSDDVQVMGKRLTR